MAAPFTDTDKIGVDLNSVNLAADLTRLVAPDHRLGTQVFASNGRRYVYAQANAALTASLAVVDINTTTFLAAASGGTYTSPATAMASGDRGWFFKASV